jgi:ribosome-binding factor A
MSRSVLKTKRAALPSQRQYKVGELLRKTLVDVLEREEIRDPDLKGISITISEVSVSPDLKAATVYVMPLGGRQQDNVLLGLKRAARFLRSKMARRVELRVAPKLDFKIDNAFDTSNNLNKVLKLTESNLVRNIADDGTDGVR